MLKSKTDLIIRSTLLIALLAITATAQPVPISNPLSDTIGVNIHFTDPKPGEMEMIAAAGCKWVRMDLNWSAIERTKGGYDFTAYDRLVATLEKFGMKAIFILDYNNKMYDDGLSPHTDAGREGFAKWAAATARHFAGKGMMWEMWNEPNGSFWKPTANVDDYAQLALATGKALRETAPGEAYIGPATSEIDLKFLEPCFKAGCLEYWSAVSVHPYRQTTPETAVGEYRALRQLIHKYAPKGKTIPIISGEWGYSAAWKNFDEDKQAKYLVREMLTNQWQEIPVSIWYDWHDDGADPKEPEHHFGTVRNEYRNDVTPVYEPKPAYVAMKTMGDQLAGYRFDKRLLLENAADYAMLFSNGEDVKLAAWTTAEAHEVKLPASAGKFSVIGWDGKVRDELTVDAAGLAVKLSDAPSYLRPVKPNDFLRCAANVSRLPLEIFVHGPGEPSLTVRFTNPLDRPILGKIDDSSPETYPGVPKTHAPFFDWVAFGGSTQVPVSRDSTPKLQRSTWDFTGLGKVIQETQVIVTNPLTITVLPRAGDVLPVQISDPEKAGLKANVTLVGIEGLEVEENTKSVEMKPGESQAVVRFTAKADGVDYSVGVQITDEKGKVIADQPQENFEPIPDFGAAVDGKVSGFELATDGDKNVASEASLAIGTSPGPEPGMGIIKLSYKSDRGWKFWQVKPTSKELRTIKGEPKAIEIWINGDGAAGLPRLRFVDSTGQTFQAAGEKITWKGWRLIRIPMDTAAVSGSHWGGKNDGVIHYPVSWDTLFLLDRDRAHAAEGAIDLAGPTLIR